MGKSAKEKMEELGELIINKIYSDVDLQSPEDVGLLINTLLVLTYQRFYLPVKDNKMLESDEDIEDFFIEKMARPAFNAVHVGYKKSIIN
jgi:hypothetical protein